jgi:decaprenylphospho-beta-D-erythro-pentofuranosid-2-ulose 2-reductase
VTNAPNGATTNASDRARSVLVIGGTSDIGRATALAYAEAGWEIAMTARNEEDGKRSADDVAARTGAAVTLHALDILDTAQHEVVLAQLSRLPDTVVCVVGDLGDQDRAQTDPQHATSVIRTNFEGPALLLGLLAERFLARGSGTIVGVSSVAGDRGRGSNYVYGAAKAGFTAFLSGLRNRLASKGVRVVTVKPGFVRTRMTAQMTLPPLLTAEPSEVAHAIFSAERQHRDVIYARWIWRPIMVVIRGIPERLFKRLQL